MIKPDGSTTYVHKDYVSEYLAKGYKLPDQSNTSAVEMIKPDGSTTYVNTDYVKEYLAKGYSFPSNTTQPTTGTTTGSTITTPSNSSPSISTPTDPITTPTTTTPSKTLADIFKISGLTDASSLGNLDTSSLLEIKTNLYKYLIDTAKQSIIDLTAKLETYKNADGTYQDNEATQSIVAEIKNIQAAEESAQIAIKALIVEKYEAEWAGFDKLQENAEWSIKNAEAMLEFSKQIGKSNESIMAQESNILALKEKSLQAQIAQQELLKNQITTGLSSGKFDVDSVEYNTLIAKLQSVTDNLISSVNSEISSLNSQLERTNKLQLEAVEKQLFNGKTQEDAQDELQAKIDLQNKFISGEEKDLEISKIKNRIISDSLTLTAEQSALLDSQGEIERTKLDRLSNQLDIQEAMVKLENLQNQKSIQQITKKDDGTWDFTYVADQEAIIQAQDDLATKKVDLIKWEQDQINTTDKEILDEKAKYLSKLTSITEKAQNGEYDSFDSFSLDMQNLNKKYLNGMGTVTTAEWQGIFDATKSSLDSMKSSYSSYVASVEDLAVRAQQAYQNILAANAAAAQAQADAAKARATAEAQAKIDAENAKNNSTTQTSGTAWTPTTSQTQTLANLGLTQESYSQLMEGYMTGDPIATATYNDLKNKVATGSYADGGVADYTGLAQVHGSKTSSEVYFNSGQAKKLYDLVKSIPSGFDLTKIPMPSILDSFKSVDLAKSLSSAINKTSQSVQQVFNINASFPNVTVKDEIKACLIGLPEYVSQQVHVVGAKD